MKKSSVKNPAFLAGALLFACAGIRGYAAAEPKISAYVRAGSSTGLLTHDITDNDASFTGSNITFNASATSAHIVAAAQAKVKLSSADTYRELYTASSWEKAYLGFDIPAYPPLRVWGGHGLPLALSGGFFTQLDVYAAGTRWLKDGVALQHRGGLFSVGAGITSNTTTGRLLYKGIAAGGAVQFDGTGAGLPVQAGVALTLDNYDAAAHYFTVEERDVTCAAFLQYKPSRAVTVSAGYCINGAPVPLNTTYKFVEDYSKSANQTDVAHSHIVTLNSSWKIGAFSIDQEAEGAKSFDERYYTGYGLLRAKLPPLHLGTEAALSFAPSVQYFAVVKHGDSDAGRDSCTLYPRFYLEKGRHQLSFGAKFEHREMQADSYHWIFKLPAYYKYTL
ncbi:MAG: hypothetical protein K6G80_00180 [Treponema sp.]|nr:hypothetical protein [Treponema sp.]